MTYLLDTNVISEPLVKAPNPSVLARLQENERELSICSVVWHELTFGARRLPEGKRRRAIETYLADVVGASLPILPYDARAAAWHGGERARLQQSGIIAPFADGQIASIAWANELVLVTRNPGRFSHFRGLSVENWFEGAA